MSLDEFRTRYPWPAEFRSYGRPREWFWQFDLPAPPEAIWPQLADTARTNRAAGLAEMHYEEKDGLLHGWHRTAGLKHNFVERWQWIAPSRLEMTRDYRTGIAKLMRQIFALERHGDGARLYVYFGWVPRGALGSVAVRIGMASFGSKFRRMVEQIGKAAGKGMRAAILLESPTGIGSESLRRLDTLRRELHKRGADPQAVDHLIELARTGDDMDLDRIRVRVLARQWGIDERTLLVAALHATRCGLLRLTWDVMCPHCRGVRDSLESLGDVPAKASCDACAIEFDTERAEALEVTFRLHPSVREVSPVVYCSAQPAKRPHIHLQQELPPGDEREVLATLGPGRYRARRKGEQDGPILVVSEGQPGQRVEWASAGEPGPLEVGPEPVFNLRAGQEPATFVVEEAGYDEDALRPATVFGVAEFRDLFTEEYLSAGLKLDIGEQTVLFTDIVGSTEFYARAGDPAAFVAVKKHFQKVFGAVADNQGAVVKTIGDAVMATFSDPLHAICAAAHIHREFPGPGKGADSDLRLRISVHRGPCIAVNLNSGIDYFGGTVNTAAKLQACAGAGEVAISADVLAPPGIRSHLGTLGGDMRPDTLAHAALGELDVMVWTPPVD